MLIGMIEGMTRIIGKSQGYRGLALRDEIIVDPVNGSTAVMISAWQPTPDELVRLNAGASVHLRVLGTAHPPVALEVGDPPA